MSEQSSKKSNSSYSLLLKGFSDVHKPKKPRSSMSSSAKQRSPEKDENKNEDNYDVPDRSFGDYYCKICDSHMNSDNMWEAHVTGKRHLKNVKKGDTDSKYEDLPDVESSIKYEMRNVKDPVVGLSYIHEIRRKEPNVPPIYNCFLCHASIATVPLVTEHVLSMKHRLNYIKENNPDEYQLIEATNLKKGHMEPLVVEAVRAMEQKMGRGTVKVKQEKKKNPVVTYSAKRTFNLNDDIYDDDDDYQKSYKNSRDDDSMSIWKSVDTSKSFDRQERSRSPRDFVKDFMTRSRSRSPRDFGRKETYPEEPPMNDYKRSFSKRDRSPPRSFSKRDLSPPQSFSKRDLSPPQSFSKRDLSPPRSFSKRDRSPPRSFSKRNHSPRPDNCEKPKSFSKRDASPEHDYPNFRNIDDYSQSSRKNNSHERLNYMPSRPDHDKFTNIDHHKSSRVDNQKSISYVPQNLPSITVNIPSQPKSWESLYEDILQLSNEDCYKLLSLRLKTLPEIKTVDELIAIAQFITEAQKKFKTVVSTLKNQKSDLSSNIIPGLGSSNIIPGLGSSNIIPGLGDALSSSAGPHNITADNSHKLTSSASFLNDIFNNIKYSPHIKSTVSQVKSFPFQLPTSFSPTISSQHTALANPYQAPPTNYQVAPANSYQVAPANSYQSASAIPYSNQTVNHPPNVPFASSTEPNCSANPAVVNIPNQNAQAPPPQIFNYSHYSSTSVPAKNFPHKY